MEPVTTFAAALSAIKAATELVTAYRKGKSKLDPETEKLLSEVESRLFSLQKEVLQFKEQEVALVEENSKLRGQIRSHEEGAADREQYKRKQLRGTTVLVRDDEPDTYYCPSCFAKNRQAIPLSRLSGVFAVAGSHLCPGCDAVFNL